MARAPSSKPGTPSRKPRRVSKAERWLNLLAFLLDRRSPVPREEILSQVDDYKRDWRDKGKRESVRRKFERDKQELKALGIVIEPQPSKVEAGHTRMPVDGYQLHTRDFYLPYLSLVDPRRAGTPGPYSLASIAVSSSEQEILRRAAERVLALGPTPLGPSAASALRKLSFDLPGVVPGDEEQTITAPVGAGFARAFEALREGLERHTAVRCRYYSIGRDAEEDRVIEPFGLMLCWGHWYCIARARERDAIRVFRLDRMRSAAVVEGAGSGFTVPADFRLSRYLNRTPWELSDAPPVTARVRLAFPHSRWTIAEGLGRVVQAVDGEGGAVLEFDVRAPEAFLRWLLPFGSQADLLEPADLRAALAGQRARVRALYR